MTAPVSKRTKMQKKKKEKMVKRRNEEAYEVMTIE
jgi:hypothetical protein